jgi:hypothetical protein
MVVEAFTQSLMQSGNSAAGFSDSILKLPGGRVVPEVEPEVSPEVVPEVEPEVLPEVPEVSPEVLPEVVSLVLPEPVSSSSQAMVRVEQSAKRLRRMRRGKIERMGEALVSVERMSGVVRGSSAGHRQVIG